jgi:protease-4
MARKKGWIIFLLVLGFFMILGGMFILGIRTMLEDRPIVKDNTVLKLRLSGLVTEQFSRDAFGREFEDASLQMHDIHHALAMAKVDKRIRGLQLVVNEPDLGWAKAREIRQVLQDFKTSGKFVTAFMETCNERSYYIACVADEIYLQPHSFVEFNGLASEVPFLKRMFNKLGMEPQVETIGKYKNAGDVLKRESMTPAHREATLALLEDIYDEFVQTVCARRGLERVAFESLLNKGIYKAEDALKEKFVDQLKYETEVTDLLKEKIFAADSTNWKERSLNTLSVSRYARVPAEDVGLAKGSKIALIYAIGSIVSGDGGIDPLFGRSMGSNTIADLLRTAKNNSAVKAVVLRVDSPGGSAVASDVIWAEIEKVQQEKPVIVSMSDVAASGGYWISMGCDAIVAQPTTITGSIGVVGSIFDLSGTYDKLGINWETVKKCEHADNFTEKRPLTDEEWQLLKDHISAIYDTFLGKAAEGRRKTREEVDKVGQGRVWTGVRALQYGLIDSLGGLDAALAIAKKKAGLAADAPTQWIVYPQPKSFFDSLVEKLSVRLAKLWASKFEEWAVIQKLPAETKQALRQIAIMRQFRNGEALAVEPQVPIVR